jgi:hypothetical protein
MRRIETLYPNLNLMRRLIGMFFLGSVISYGQTPSAFPSGLGPSIMPFWNNHVFEDVKLILHLKNDSIVTLKADFDVASKQNVITIRDRKGTLVKVYKPEDTKSIVRKLPGDDMKGIPADTCWLFKVISGKIKGYTNMPFYTEAIVAFKFGEGDILPLTIENFEAIAPPDDKNFVRLIRKKKWVEAIHYYNRNIKWFE